MRNARREKQEDRRVSKGAYALKASRIMLSSSNCRTRKQISASIPTICHPSSAHKRHIRSAYSDSLAIVLVHGRFVNEIAFEVQRKRVAFVLGESLSTFQRAETSE